MKSVLEQFKAFTKEERIAFMKEAMPLMLEDFGRDPKKMMAEMMPVCMNMMGSTGFGMDRMRDMMKTMMG